MVPAFRTFAILFQTIGVDVHARAHTTPRTRRRLLRAKRGLD